MGKRSTGMGAVASLALACIFGATLLLSLAAGAVINRRVAERVERGSAERVGLTYITAKLQAHNGYKTIRSEKFGGEEALWLRDEIGGTAYDTILYVHDGYLMELLCEEGAALEPEDGLKITEAGGLRVRQEEALLCLEFTDAAGQTETARVFLRGGV